METRRIILSSGRMNRKGYRIPIENISYDDYLANPVMLAEHEYDQNIGHMTDIRVENGKLSALPVFATTELGQRYAKLYAERGINAVSIGGWVKLNAERTEATSFDLWECSLVSVPADPGAVAIEGGAVLSAEQSIDKLSGISEEVRKEKEAQGFEFVTLNCMDEMTDDNGCDSHSADSDIVDDIIGDNHKSNLSASAEQNKTNKIMEDNKDKVVDQTTQAQGTDNLAAPASAPGAEDNVKMNTDNTASNKSQDKLGLNPNMKTMEMSKHNVTGQRASLSALLKDKGMDGVMEMVNRGNDAEKLYVFDAIRNTAAGKVFMDTLGLNIETNRGRIRVGVDAYLRDRESLSAPLHDMQKLSMNGNAKLNASTDFIGDPALDRIAFASMAFLKLFPSNLWVNRMQVLPVQMTGDGVGVVWVNVGFDSKVTTQPVQTNTSVTPATIEVKTDTPVSMQIYEHDLAPMLFRRYNQDIVAYDQLGLQWDVALNNLFTKMYDWDLYTLANIIATTVSGYTPKIQGTTGAAFAPSSLWTKVPGNVSQYKGLTMNDIISLEAFFQSQGVRIESLNPVINIDPALNLSLTQDPIVQTRLTRFVAGEKGEDIRVSYSRVYTRQYLGCYNTSSNAVVDPVSGSPTSADVQYGLALIPEYVLRGWVGMEIYTKIEPTLYGEVYSAQSKSGIAPAYADNKGTAIIVPTANA